MTLEQAQTELQRHTFDTFMDHPPNLTGAKGIVVPGCPTCSLRLQTMNQFMRHLADDVLPVIFGEREPGDEAQFDVSKETLNSLDRNAKIPDRVVPSIARGINGPQRR